MAIKVRYSTIDRFSKTGTFKTLAGAQRFAQKWVGKTPDLGSDYAVSMDGVGKVAVEGAPLYDLFPELAKTAEQDTRIAEHLDQAGLGYMQGRGAS